MSELSNDELNKIEQNKQEDRLFKEQIDKYYNNSLDRKKPLLVSTTPLSLSICGANEKLNVVINPSTLDKCVSSPTDIYHGHDLERNIIEQIPKQLRNPVLIFANKEKNALVAITGLRDAQNRGIMIAIGMERAGARYNVNRIASVYGRNNFTNYINTQIKKDNLLAYNKKRAEELLQSVGLQLPSEETAISYDDTIAYTTAHVKYPKKEKNQRSDILRDKIHIPSEEVKPETVKKKKPKSR